MSKNKKFKIYVLVVACLLIIIAAALGIRYWNDHKSPNFTRAYTLFARALVRTANTGVVEIRSFHSCFGLTNMVSLVTTGMESR